MEDLGCINNNNSEVGLIRSFSKDFLKISNHSHSLMLSSSKLKPPWLPKNSTIQSGIRITFRRTEWGKFHHPCIKAPIKGKEVQKNRKRKYYGTDDKIIDVSNLYPVPLLQILLGNSNWNFKILVWKKARLKASEKVHKADEFVLYMSRECINSKNEEKNWYGMT